MMRLGHALETVDELAYFDGRREVDEQVYMAWFAVELLKVAVEVLAHVHEHMFKRVQMLVGEHLVPVFRDPYEYQCDRCFLP